MKSFKEFTEELKQAPTAHEIIQKKRKQAFEKAIKPMKDKFVGKEVEKK